jgi:hypothetical protein
MTAADEFVGHTAAPVRVDRRVTMFTGIAFAVLFVLGMLFGPNTPDGNASDAEWTDWYDDGGHRAMQIVSAFLLVLAAVALVIFLALVVRQLRAARPDRDVTAQVVFGGGLVLAAAIAFGGIAMAQMSAAIEIGDIPIPSADVLRTAEQLGFGLLLVAGGLFAALTVAAVSFGARGTGLLPAWLVTTGYVVAVILLFSVMFIPLILLPLWAIAVAVATRQ